jgi:hypothetical protein
MDAAINRKSKPQQKRPVSTPLLMSSSLVETVVREINEGNSLTLKDIQARLHCEKDKAVRIFRNEPGVTKIGKAYLIPQSVFDRVVSRGLIQPR